MRSILFVILFVLFVANTFIKDEPIYISGRFSEWVEVDSLPFAGYRYYSRYSPDSLTKYYCIRQSERLYMVGCKKLTENNFLWNPKYLKKEVLP